ncbi:MAG: hypothetical protein OHK0046_22350 [Anaerolineae bacterium]
MERSALIAKLRALPAQLESLVAGLTDEQLTTPYLEGEWTVAQNIHHVMDSHMHSYIRCKLILTQEHPPLRPYDQNVWAALPDATQADVSLSLAVIKGLHARWVSMFESLPDDAWERAGAHPEIGDVTLAFQLDYYAKHGEAHIDQITRTLAAGGIRA